jgi:hypothetical protein
MIDRPAQAIAKPYGQSGVPFQPARRAGHLSARGEAIGSDVHLGMPFANRLSSDENLLRQIGYD